MSQTTAPLAALDKITGHCHTALMQAQMAGRFATETSAKRHAEAATEELRSALRGLKSAGGNLPGASLAPSSSSLAGLASLSTPSSRELLTLLRGAVAVAERVDAERVDAERVDAERVDAERVDAERGRVAGKSSSGDVAGTDLAEALHFLALRVSDEVEGAQSGRE